MDIQDLGQDRFLRKDPNQSANTKDPVYTSANPAPKRGDDSFRKLGRPKGSEEDDGAPNILTGTVIVSCFIQTTALPSRIEIQGNDITFFDDTYSQNGRLIGDTSRIVFTHGSAKSGEEITSGFIIQKRASTLNTYDNVLEIFSPDNSPNTNILFIGRTGTGTDRNISVIEMAPDHRTAVGDSKGYVNGIFRVRVSRDGVDADYRDGVYIMDRGTESSTREGTVNWLVAAGSGGQNRLSYMANRDDNPLTESLYDLYISSVGFTFFGVPTVNPGVAGRLWSDNGTLKIGAGSAATSAAYNPTLTGTPSIGATSATLSVSWPGSTDSRICMFQNGDIRLVNFTNGSTSLNWSTGLSAGAGGNQIFTYN